MVREEPKAELDAVDCDVHYLQILEHCRVVTSELRLDLHADGNLSGTYCAGWPPGGGGVYLGIPTNRFSQISKN